MLIMDEPSSALSSTEVETLFRVINDLKQRGVAIVYISHRLEEIMRIGDYVTVLRDGHLQAEAKVADIDVPWIIGQMVGAASRRRRPPTTRRPASRCSSSTIWCCRARAAASSSITFRFPSAPARSSAIYGLLGAGRSELFECLIGADQRALRPHHARRQADITGASIASRIARGLVLVPEDRQREGIISLLPVSQNLTMASIARFARSWIINRGRREPRLSPIRSASFPSRFPRPTCRFRRSPAATSRRW